MLGISAKLIYYRNVIKLVLDCKSRKGTVWDHRANTAGNSNLALGPGGLGGGGGTTELSTWRSGPSRQLPFLGTLKDAGSQSSSQSHDEGLM